MIFFNYCHYCHYGRRAKNGYGGKRYHIYGHIILGAPDSVTFNNYDEDSDDEISDNKISSSSNFSLWHLVDESWLKILDDYPRREIDLVVLDAFLNFQSKDEDRNNTHFDNYTEEILEDFHINHIIKTYDQISAFR